MAAVISIPLRFRGSAALLLVVAMLLAGLASSDASAAAAQPAASAAPPPAAAATYAADAAVPRPYPWRARIRQATRHADSRRGVVGFAVIDERGAVVGGRHLRRGFRSASVVKVVMMVCYLNHRSVRSRALTRRDRALLDPMIRRSANGPANHIYSRFGRGCIERAAARAGMRGFTTQSVWGRSRITPVGAARMMRRVHLLVPQRHRAYAMRLLASVVPSQRWGLPPVAPAGWTIRFKGGWAGSVVNQAAVFQRGERRFAIAVLTSGNRSYGYGHSTLRGIGGRLLRGYSDYDG